MAAEIVIDDGGSTRIKQLGKRLDSLLDINSIAVGTGPEPGAPGSNVKAFGDFVTLRVIVITNDGGSTTTDKPLAVGDTFQVVSRGEQRIHGLIVAAVGGVAAHCLCTIYGISNVEPIISAKQTNGQRRYVVENAGRIKKVMGPGADIDLNPDTDAYATVILKEA
ncbi:MAG TPA: hypothetical protein VFB63_17790 [Bryobacteraceae bacterium]|jgi:hypothetical protein|nr:hypothetical protein [Bryobacteraceae bacterium]